jgi:hypothetical protein
LSTANRHSSSPSDNSEVRSARSPLTAGSIACIQFTSNAHTTVVTSVALLPAKKVAEKAAPDLHVEDLRFGRSNLMSQPAPYSGSILRHPLPILSSGSSRLRRVWNMSCTGRFSTVQITCCKNKIVRRSSPSNKERSCSKAASTTAEIANAPFRGLVNDHVGVGVDQLLRPSSNRLDQLAEDNRGWCEMPRKARPCSPTVPLGMPV